MSVKASDFRLEEPNKWCTIREAIEILEKGGYHGDIYIGVQNGEGFQYIGPPDAEKITETFNDILGEKKSEQYPKYYSLVRHKIEEIGDLKDQIKPDMTSDEFLEVVHMATALKKLTGMAYNLKHFFENYVDILDRPIVKPVRARIQDECPIFIVDGQEKGGSWWKDEPKKYHRV